LSAEIQRNDEDHRKRKAHTTDIGGDRGDVHEIKNKSGFDLKDNFGECLLSSHCKSGSHGAYNKWLRVLTISVFVTISRNSKKLNKRH
jgi:hypothetical protein